MCQIEFEKIRSAVAILFGLKLKAANDNDANWRPRRPAYPRAENKKPFARARCPFACGNNRARIGSNNPAGVCAPARPAPGSGETLARTGARRALGVGERGRLAKRLMAAAPARSRDRQISRGLVRGPSEQVARAQRDLGRPRRSLN